MRRLGKQLASKGAQREIAADQRTAFVADATALADEIRILAAAA